jgi:hypothetical protein
LEWGNGPGFRAGTRKQKNIYFFLEPFANSATLSLRISKKPMKTFACILSISASLTFAQAQSYIASLNGAQDGGGARQGSGSVNLTLSGLTLSLSGSYSGLTTPMTAGHIHGPAAPGVNGNVIYDLVGPGVLTGTTSGTYSGSVTITPVVTGYTTTAQQISDLNAGLWYLNIHDSTFPGGEIRGQITLVPEPSSLALLGLGAGALVYRLRRRIA